MRITKRQTEGKVEKKIKNMCLHGLTSNLQISPVISKSN